MSPEGTFTIVFSNSIPAGDWGGGEKWMVTCARGLADRGHQVIVAGRSNSVFLDRARTADLETVAFNLHADFSPMKSLKIQRFLQARDVEVIILNLNKDVRVAGWAARRAGVPVILARNGYPLLADTWVHRLSTSLVDGIITNTNAIKDIYRDIPWLPQSKIRVIPNGIALPEQVPTIDLRQRYKIPADHLVLMAIGRLVPEKGFDLLVPAMARAKRENLPCTVLIAGEGSMERQLEAMIRSQEVSDRIRLIGFVDDPLGHIQSGDFLILTSRQEGMPNVVLEAMALGKPVLSAAISGTTDLIEHMRTGYLFEPHDPQAIFEALQFACDHRKTDLCRKLGESARRVVIEQFTIPRMLDRLEQYFLEIYERSTYE